MLRARLIQGLFVASIVGCGSHGSTATSDAGDRDASLDGVSDGAPDSVVESCHVSGQLDPTFGVAGIAAPIFASMTPIAATGLRTTALIEPSGRIVIAGEMWVRSGYRFAVAALLEDGTLDPSFGTDGRFTLLAPGMEICELSAVGRQSTSKLVAAGNCGVGTDSPVALIRLTPNGALDPTFGDGGILLDRPVLHSVVTSMVVDANDRIVITGYTYDPPDDLDTGIVTARYLPDGLRDMSFGAAGVAAEASHETGDLAWDVAVQDDGGVLVAAETGPMSHTTFTLLRYAGDGTLDTTFATGGTYHPLGESSAAHTLSIDAVGRVLVSGYDSSMAVVVRLADGQPDLSFGSDGIANDPIAAGPIAFSQTDTTFYALGETSQLQPAMLAHYSDQGARDLAFSNHPDGYGRAPSPGYPRVLPLSLLAQPDGKLVVVGTESDPQQPLREDFFVARFCP